MIIIIIIYRGKTIVNKWRYTAGQIWNFERRLPDGSFYETRPSSRYILLGIDTNIEILIIYFPSWCVVSCDVLYEKCPTKFRWGGELSKKKKKRSDTCECIIFYSVIVYSHSCANTLHRPIQNDPNHFMTGLTAHTNRDPAILQYYIFVRPAYRFYILNVIINRVTFILKIKREINIRIYINYIMCMSILQPGDIGSVWISL